MMSIFADLGGGHKQSLRWRGCSTDGAAVGPALMMIMMMIMMIIMIIMIIMIMMILMIMMMIILHGWYRSRSGSDHDGDDDDDDADVKRILMIIKTITLMMIIG